MCIAKFSEYIGFIITPFTVEVILPNESESNC